MWMHDGYGFWGLGGILMILFWVLVVLAIAALVRWLALGPGISSDRESGGEGRRRKALEILEERYAKGDIDREEYLQKRQDLEQ